MFTMFQGSIRCMQMEKAVIFLVSILSSFQFVSAQDFGSLPRIKKEKLLLDLGILHQALDKYHTGMYWYTPKDSVDIAFETAKQNIR